MPPSPGQPLGRQGERLARRALRKAGLKILAANFRCPAGEIDLIALDRSAPAPGTAGTIVFVEVKTRRPDAGARPEAAVDADKRRRIRSAAAYYLRHYPTDGYRHRFDVVSVLLDADGPADVRHIPAAF